MRALFVVLATENTVVKKLENNLTVFIIFQHISSKFFSMKSKTGSKRLKSLDTLRGFDMFWIMGGEHLIIALAAWTGWKWMDVVAAQMHHVEWEGFHFYDFIFPLFMFISGVAIPYAIISRKEKGESNGRLAAKIVRRGITLFLLGLVYNGLLSGEFKDIRFASVLGQIGFAYMFAALIFLYTHNLRARIFWITGILVFIAFMQLWIPVPGYGAGLLDPVGGMNAWLDRQLLPGVLHGKTFDPEGILCIVSAVTVTLLGGVAGSILRDSKRTEMRKTLTLLIIGGGLTLIAILLSPYYPIIKKAWTVPFNLLTSGLGFLVLALFYYLIDVASFTSRLGKALGFFFTVIGMNSITIYMAGNLIDFHHTSQKLSGWLAAYLEAEWVIIVFMMAIEWLLLWFLYRKKIFLRV